MSGPEERSTGLAVRFIRRLQIGENGERGSAGAARLARFRTPAFSPSEDELVAQAPPVRIRDLFRRFWPYTKTFRPVLFLTFAVVAIVPAVDTALIWMYKLLIDRVVVPHDFGPFFVLVTAYLGLTLLSGVVLFVDRYLSTWVGERFVLDLRRDFFRHVQGLSLDFLDRRRLGDIVSRLTNDISTIETFVVSGLGDALAYVLRIGFFAGALFFLSWKLAVAALLVGPLFLLVTRLFTRPIRDASREKRRRVGSISAAAEESLSNALLVQAYGQEEFEVKRVHREGRGSFAAELRSARLKGFYAPLISSLEALGLLLVVGLGTWELSHSRISIGGLLVFVTYLSQLYSPIRRIGRLGNTVSSASAAAERVIEFLDQRPSIAERPNPIALERAGGSVAFESVQFRYSGTQKRALADVSFAIRSGETLALVGPSGAGKSTIAKLLLRFYDPQAGRVLLDGHDVRDLSLRSLRGNVAVVLQETLVFDGTVRDNIAYGRRGATDRDIEAAARAADAHDFILALPNGYDTVVGQKGRLLSGGQRQRLAIARAMIRDAPVLLLDEPTTGLDADSAERILGPLRRLMSGRATIIISHNLLSVREATMILVLEDGTITGRGTHAELLARNKTYARLYRRHHLEAAPNV